MWADKVYAASGMRARMLNAYSVYGVVGNMLANKTGDKIIAVIKPS